MMAKTIRQKAEIFRQLHLSGETFIMPNAWNAGSAVLFEQAGFEAFATTSAGIAYAHAVPDSAGALGFERALQETAEMAAAVDIPLSMDAENFYAETLREVKPNLQRILESGVVGANIEDFTGRPEQPLYDFELAVERVQAAVEAVTALDYPFTLCARTDCFLVGQEDAMNESIRRLNRYREAGADCLYAPGLRDLDSIKTLVKEVDGPLNVVMGLSGAPIALDALRQAGVARISIGGSLARACFGRVRRAAAEMLEHGSFDYAQQQIADGELSELFKARLQ